MSTFFGNLKSNHIDATKGKKTNFKTNSQNSTNNDKSKSQNNNENNEETFNRDALIKQLGILNMSLDSIYVILVAVIINIEFIKIEIVRVTDRLNNTNLSEGLPDDSEWPKLTNLMYLYVTGIFLLLNYTLYQEAIAPNNNTTQKEESRAFRAFLSSLLIFIATGLSKANLEI